MNKQRCYNCQFKKWDVMDTKCSITNKVIQSELQHAIRLHITVNIVSGVNILSRGLKDDRVILQKSIL